MRVSRTKGIQRLWGETRVMKNCPTAPVIHGTLHLRPGGGQPVGILRWRSIRLAPRARLRTRRWSLAGGGLVGTLSGLSPASALSPRRIMSINIPPRSLFLKRQWCTIPLRRHLSPDYIPFCPTGPCGPSLASCRRFGLLPRKSPLQNTVVVRNTGIRESAISLEGMRLRLLSPGRPGLTLGNPP